MDKQTVIAKLRENEPALRAEGISRLFLFGSVARGEADEKSDVDLFYDYDKPLFSLIDVITVQEQIETILGQKVDAMTRRSLHPLIRGEVEREAIRVF